MPPALPRAGGIFFCGGWNDSSGLVLVGHKSRRTGKSMKIISVHAPKAGGTSISSALSNAFGPEFAMDYSEDPADPRSPRNIDPISPGGESCPKASAAYTAIFIPRSSI
jgi:hypothetical protein